MFIWLFHPYNEWNMLLKFDQVFLKHPVYSLYTVSWNYIFIKLELILFINNIYCLLMISIDRIF